MIPARFAPVLFGLIMSWIVSGIAIYRAIGLNDVFFGSWMASWSFSWPVAFCVVLVVAPFTKRIVAWLVKS